MLLLTGEQMTSLTPTTATNHTDHQTPAASAGICSINNSFTIHVPLINVFYNVHGV